MTELQYLIIHCSATPATMDVTADDIRSWHQQRGWKQVGYADLITRDGTLVNLVPYDENEYVESHEITNGAIGYNGKSRHVCLAGGVDENGNPQDNFTLEQKTCLVDYIKRFIELHPDCKVIGHNEISAKACPSFDVQRFLKQYGIEL